MPYPQPKTVLRNWDKARASDPALTTEQMAIRLCMPHGVFLAKLQEARYMRDRRSPPVQVGAVTTFELDASKDDWQQWFLLQSDNHHDSIQCNRDLETEHLEDALDKRAIVFMFGDVLDAMQGRFDPRRSMDELRPEYRGEDYYDFVVTDCAEFYGRYAPQIGIMSDGNHECVDDQTDVLTSAGWKSIKDVTLDDSVLSIQGVDMVPIYAKPIKTHTYNYHGKMVRVEHPKLDMLMTPNHRVAYIPQKANYIHYLPAAKLMKYAQIEIPVSVDFDKDEHPISDDEIRFAAWILTDGSLSHGSYDIYQSKPLMVEHIDKLLAGLNFQYSHAIRQRNIDSIVGRKLINKPLPEHMFRLIGKQSKQSAAKIISAKGKMPEWVFGLSKRQFDIFVNELILGDGSREKRSKTALVMYGEKAFLSDLQRACVQYGYRANISERHRNGERSYDALNITEHKTIEAKDLKPYTTLEDFSGDVYCLTTVTGNFFARRNGTVYLTGNCAVLKNANTDLLGRLVGALNTQGGNVLRGGYGGWVRLVFGLGNGKQIIKRIKYFHGSGGEAPVTRGAIQTNRQAVFIPDADFVVNGHSHNQYHISISRERVDEDGKHYFDLQHHLRVPGYKQAYGDGTSGWEVTRGGVPKPIGAIWLHAQRKKDDIVIMVLSDIRAPDLVSYNPNDLYTGRVYGQDGEGT